MKKWISLLLSLTLVLGLAACGKAPAQTPEATEPPVESWLQAGFCRVDVTPDFNIGLDGSGNADTRISKEVSDPISITCIALTDGQKTVLLYTADTLGFNNNNLALLRNQICMGTGVAQDNIFFGATHTHSAPRLSTKTETFSKYIGIFCKGAVAAGEGALADLAPARLQAATTDLPGMNFVRHYKMSDGSYAGPNFGTFEGLDIVDYAGQVDPELSMIKLDRGGSKQDILLLNWQAHPNNSTSVGYYKISADFVGTLRNKLEADTGMQVAYFTGASGNVHIDSKIESDAHGLKWDAYGEKLAELTVEALPKLQDVGGTGIATTSQFYLAQVDHSRDHMLAQAKEVYDLWKTESKAAADALAWEYGMTSVHQARAIVELTQIGKELQWELKALRVGNIGFTTGTYEMWTESGKYVKDNSPYDVTFVITGNMIYIPAEDAFAYRNYEVDTTYFVQGTAEALTEEYIKMLNAIK